jgi:hypothetical protein
MIVPTASLDILDLIPRKQMTPETADAVRHTLREVVSRYGIEIAHDPTRCQGILRDFSPAPSTRAAVAALVVACREGVADALLSPGPSAPIRIAMARVSRRMCDSHATDEGLATWAVETWAVVLGVAAPGDLAVLSEHDGGKSSATKQSEGGGYEKPAAASAQPATRASRTGASFATVRFICPAASAFGYAAGKAVRGYVKILTYGLLGGRTFGYDTLHLEIDPPLKPGHKSIGAGSLYSGFQCDATLPVGTAPYTVTAIHRVGSGESDRKSVTLTFSKSGKYVVMVSFIRSSLGGMQGSTLEIVQEP